MLRRLLVIMLALFLPVSACLAAEKNKYTPFPKIQIVKMNHKETRQKNGSIIDAFYPVTATQQTTDELKSIITDYIAKIAPTLPPGKRTPEDSKLYIRCIYSPTGESWLSFLVQARTVYHRQQMNVEATSRTYDMATGQQVHLTDIFPGGSPAWDVLAKTVREQLTAYFPEDPDPAALDELVTRESLEDALFTLEPVKMVLHYPAALLYPNRSTLMNVKIYYRDLEGMMTEEAAKQTDNSSRPMIALTFDDGPRYVGTVDLLDDLQYFGVRATFFLIGDQMDRNRDVVQREHDEGHTIASHTWNHYDPRNLKTQALFEGKEKFDQLLSDIIGLKSLYMRAPGGRYQEFAKAGIGLPIIQWSAYSGDISATEHRTIWDKVSGNTENGTIILLHDSRNVTVKAMPRALYDIRTKGVFCVPVEDLFVQNGRELLPNVVYMDANGWVKESQ